MVTLMFATGIAAITALLVTRRWIGGMGTNTALDMVMVAGVLGGFTSCTESTR